MIIQFSVENFASIKNKQSISFEARKSNKLSKEYLIKEKTSNGKRLYLLKFILLYGANASGKTTVLNAMKTLKNLIFQTNTTKDKEIEFYKPFLLDKDARHKPTQFEIEFVYKKHIYRYSVKYNKQSVLEEKLQVFYTQKPSTVFYRKTNNKTQVAEIEFSRDIPKDYAKVLVQSTLWNATVLGTYLQKNINIEVFSNVIDWFKEYYLAEAPPTNWIEKMQRNQNIKDLVLKILKKADFSIDDIKIKNEIFDKDTHNVFTLRFKHKDEYLSYADESHGTQVFLKYVTHLLDLIYHSKLIILDEIETALHPDLLEHFILMFLDNAKHSQIIATTHYREWLMNRDYFRDDSIYFTEKNKEQSTEIFSLADFGTDVIRNENSVYNFYKKGKLGAAPDLLDTYIPVKN